MATGQRNPATRDTQTAADHDPILSRIVDVLDPYPSYVCDAAYNVQAHNRAFTVWVWDFMAQPVGQRNFARWLFCHPHARHMLPNWHMDSWGFVARMRQIYTQLPRHPGFADLIVDLEEQSPEFRQMWHTDSAIMPYPTSLAIDFRPPGHTDPHQPDDRSHHVPLTMSTLTPMTAGDNRRFTVFLYPDSYTPPTPPTPAECTACR